MERWRVVRIEKIRAIWTSPFLITFLVLSVKPPKYFDIVYIRIATLYYIHFCFSI